MRRARQAGTTGQAIKVAVLRVHLLAVMLSLGWVKHNEHRKRKKKERGLFGKSGWSRPPFPLVLAPFALFLASKLVKDVVFLFSHAFFFSAQLVKTR